MQYRSRLKNKAKNNTLLSLFGIAILLLLIGFFGLHLLVMLCLFLGAMKNKDEVTVPTKNEYLLPPTLDPLSQATNSANFQISGNSARGGQTVEVYLNGDYKTKALTDSNGHFVISDFRLENGTNRIKERTNDGNSESAFTDEATVTVSTTPPALKVNEPTDGQTVKTAQVRVSGKTDSNATVTINDFLPVIDGSGNFSYTLPLKEGENQIKIVAKDIAGNQTTNQLKVTYQP
jgi:bacillopeptidase F